MRAEGKTHQEIAKLVQESPTNVHNTLRDVRLNGFPQHNIFDLRNIGKLRYWRENLYLCGKCLGNCETSINRCQTLKQFVDYETVGCCVNVDPDLRTAVQLREFEETQGAVKTITITITMTITVLYQ